MRLRVRTSRCDEHEECTVASISFPELSGCSCDRNVAIEFVKGAALHCIGDWPKVPSVIEFVVDGG